LLAPGPHAWGAILADIPQIPGLLSAIFRLIDALSGSSADQRHCAGGRL